jgi:hypothetical protein
MSEKSDALKLLKRKKMLQDVLAKRLDSCFTLEQILLKIDSADTDAKVKLIYLYALF